MTKQPLTFRQREVLEYMFDFYRRNDQLPPCQYIRYAFGWESNNAAQTHIDQLVRRGYLERNEVGKYRFIRAKESA